MAKKKKGRRRQSLVSKAANVGLILLGLSRPLTIVFERLNAGAPQFIAEDILDEATFGLSSGRFSLEKGLRMYGPGVAAAGLGKLKGYLMRHFPVR